MFANPYTARQLNEDRSLLERKRKEREEQHLYLSCAVITEDNFRSYQGFDLAQWDADPTLETSPKFYRVLRASTVGEFCKSIAEDKGIPAEHVRLWVMVNRQNKTVRPDQPILDPDMSVEEAYTKYGSRDKCFRLWAEVADNTEEGKAVWPELSSPVSNNASILIFLKYFDPEAQTLKGVGHIYVRKHSKVSDMIPLIQHRMGWSPSSTPVIALYEVYPSTFTLRHF